MNKKAIIALVLLATVSSTQAQNTVTSTFTGLKKGTAWEQFCKTMETDASALTTFAAGLQLDTAGLVPGTGVATWIGTPTSANFLAAITNETGSGVVVGNTSPTLVTPVLGVATGTSLALGADPADAGVIRLENAAVIGWEASAAGTDLTLTVNSDEQFVFSAAILSPTLITPALGVATVTTLNGHTFTAGSSTFTGTAAQTYTFPTTSATLARTDAANTFTGNQTFAGGIIGGSSQALSGAGAVGVTTLITKITSTGVADALTLANGTDGQIKIIVHDVDGGSSVLTPTTKTGFTTITFTAVGESATLVYVTTRGWIIVALNGAVAG